MGPAIPWTELGRVLGQGVAAYAVLILFLRLTGNRTLSKMNSFDLIVTVALGSLLATAVIDRQVGLWEGAAALGLLVALQFVVTWLSVRFRTVNRLVKTAPTLVFFQGHFRHDAMRQTRVVEDEIRSAVRQVGLGGLEEVAAVVLESDGKLTVVPMARLGSGSALRNVRGLPAPIPGPQPGPVDLVDQHL